MFYLIGQIALTIFLTALIGITMGWLLRGLGTSRQTELIEARWRARLAQLEKGAARTEPTSGSSIAEPEIIPDPEAEREIAQLRVQLRQRDELLAKLRTARSLQPDAVPAADETVSRLKETTQLCTELQLHVAEQKNVTEQLKAQLEQAKSEREMLVERLRERESEIGRMSQERQHAINTIASLQKEMRTLRGEQALAVSRAPGDSPDQTPVPKTAPTAAAMPSRAVPEPPAPAKKAAPAAAKQQSLPIKETGSVATYKPAWRLSAPKGQKDNLQAIIGIGPKLEQQLNRLGIFHFAQIGQFQSNDILWVAHHLKSFPGRIVRDRWIEQARTLHQKNAST